MTNDNLPTSKKVKSETRTQKWGPRDFKTRDSNKAGSIMYICSNEFPTIQKEDTIKHAADKMSAGKSRRLFVTEPDNTFLGIISATDIADFLGGGEKYNLIKENHNGNIAKAINEHVRKIMEEGAITLDYNDSIDSCLKKMHEKNVGYVPILKEKKIIGVVTERNLVNLISKQVSDLEVKDLMSKNVILGTSGMKIRDVAKVIVRNGFRRIPIIKEDEVVGIITTRDIVSAFAENFSTDILDMHIDNIMKKPITTKPNELAINAADKITSKGIGGLPVVKDNKVVGIITERDLMQTLI
ncbi:MAG: CBS domain-containing protein [Candidatus Undinarchaeales archaeon]